MKLEQWGTSIILYQNTFVAGSVIFKEDQTCRARRKRISWGICRPQDLRPACASMRSGQRFYFSAHLQTADQRMIQLESVADPYHHNWTGCKSLFLLLHSITLQNLFLSGIVFPQINVLLSQGVEYYTVKLLIIGHEKYINE